MGLEVSDVSFEKKDIEEFNSRLVAETKILKSWFDNNELSTKSSKTGIELEAWLIDNDMQPDPISDEYLTSLDNKKVVPEISRFNFEINSDPHALDKKVFSNIFNEVNDMWKTCQDHAKDIGTNAVMMGTLATLRPSMLSTEYLSPQNRYAIMNEQVMKMRSWKPMHIGVEGKDEIHFNMDSVIAECAATSLQIHLGVTQETAKRYYNASIIASSFMVALSANSPYLFGKELWDESRIAVFEQSVDITESNTEEGEVRRVTMGNGYLQESFFELFSENINEYGILLPELFDGKPEDLKHLMLHNGTIWRWNRPIVGPANDKDNKPHIRIEHRTPSAGPTVADAVANTAFYLGLVEYLANMEVAPETLLSFQDASKNFYLASKQSFNCRLTWLDGERHDILKLMQNELLPNVKKALLAKGIDTEDVNYYVGEIIGGRLKKGVNGAIWQKAFIHTYGKNFQLLMETYLKNQMSGKPVHEWSV